MRGLGALFGTRPPSGGVPDPADCPCDDLTPRWRGPDEMGDDARAMGFVCHRCHAEYLPYRVRGRRAR